MLRIRDGRGSDMHAIMLSGINGKRTPAGVEIATTAHHGNDSSLLLGILFHRMPVGIALMTLLITTNISIKKAWFVLIAFSLTTSV